LGLVALGSADAAVPLRMLPSATLAIAVPIRAEAVSFTAATPQDRLPTAAGNNRVLFAPGSDELSPAARNALDMFAASLAQHPDLTIELRGYAPALEDGQSQARRLSLARAIQVRAYLVADGIATLRLSLHPLGDRTPIDLPPDRVDLVASAR
jgi:outer membrane protein OmpA-like peptidoglycan-associated protein